MKEWLAETKDKTLHGNGEIGEILEWLIGYDDTKSGKHPYMTLGNSFHGLKLLQNV